MELELQPQALPDGGRQSRRVQRIKMQPRCTPFEQAVTQVGHDIEPEFAN